MERIPGRAALAILALVAAGPTTGLLAQRSAYEELQVFSGVLNHIRNNYVDSVGYSELVKAAITGMLRALDPHTRYVSRADRERLDAVERGELATTGMVLESVDGVPTVLTVFPRSPAAKQGIQSGDRIVLVNDTVVAGIEVKELELRLAGKKGSKVRVVFERGSRLQPDTFAVSVKRDEFDVFAVSAVHLVDSVTGYLRLAEFGETAHEEVERAIKKLKGSGARQVILDLRANPGGLVIAAVEIAAEFFPKGTLVFRTRGRKSDVDEDHRTERNGDFRDLPLIVLIDERSASASEALAGSLQDHDRALILGRRSFGKALMQSIFLLPAGDYLWLTLGRVITPSGRFIQRRYRGLLVEQYRAFAGTAGAAEDTVEVYHTHNGRVVRGGGGIAPDVESPQPPPFPVWWSVAVDSGLDAAVSDSVAFTLAQDSGERLAWSRDADRWRATLLEPFLDRVHARLRIGVEPDSALAARIVRALAHRVAEVRWGSEAGVEFAVANDPDIRAAMSYFPRLATLLGRPN